MSRSLIVSIPDLPEKHAARIREAAERYGFDCRFFDRFADAEPYVADAEVIVSASPKFSRAAPKLRWLSTPFAGNDLFMAADAFANPDALLTNSSGAYGVTIAEHVVMVTLALLARRSLAISPPTLPAPTMSTSFPMSMSAAAERAAI